MRIKPWAVTGTMAAIAAAGLAVVMIANDPTTAPAAVKSLFWATLALSTWGLSATVLLLCGTGLPRAAWCGLIVSLGLIAGLATWQGGWRGGRLLGAIVFATLSLAFAAWYRLRGR